METRHDDNPAALRSPGFNGATAFRRWKRAGAMPVAAAVSAASMEPPPFGDGNIPRTRRIRPHQHASMEPPPFGDGNDAIIDYRAALGTMLQWSHRLSAMETAKEHVYWQVIGHASMEPPPFGDGNVVEPADLEAGVAVASMEPPPFGDGNVMPVHERVGAEWLQWSHRLSAMETEASPHRPEGQGSASMEPPPFGDGNPATARPGRSPSTGFNGATAFRRWKPPARRSCAGPAGRCFNGATAFRRWKLQVLLLKLWQVMPLQWSHRLSAMETMSCLLSALGEFGPLQWSHRLSAMETLNRVVAGLPHRTASMEPPPFGDGNFVESVELVIDAIASMEPPPFGDGNP